MKKILFKAVLVMIGACAPLLVGCASSGTEQADKTGASIANFRAEIVKGKGAIDDTVRALDQVLLTANSDPRQAFEQYSKAVSNLESVAATAAKRSAAMREQGQAYFTQWEQELAQVTNPETRKLAEQRKAKLQAAFDKIRTYSEPLKAQFDPWMSDLKDLRTYLSNDLTIEGVDSAKSLIVKTKAGGVVVQKSMDGLIAELNTISAALTAAKASQQPATQPAK